MKNMRKSLILATSALVLSACATNLVDRTPVDIASDSFRHVDSMTGSAEVLGPSVTPILNKRNYIKAKAYLRTAGAFTSRDGAVTNGGSYLDILLSYTTATPHPDEARVYDQVSFAGGQTAELAHFGDTVVDCRQEVREVNHFGHYGYYPYYSHYGSYWGRHGYDSWGRWDPRRRPHHRRDKKRDPGVGDDPVSRRKPGTRPRPRPGDVREPGDRRRPPVQPRPQSKRTKPVVYEPSSVHRPTSRPRPVVRPTPVSKPKPRPVTKRPTARPAPVDKAFSKTRNRRTSSASSDPENIRYYPAPHYTDYEVRYRCERQESLRVFIPRERLDFAQSNGLLVYLRPRAGVEETVVLPANYISGFKLAAYSPDGPRIAQTSTPRPVYPPSYSQAAPAPLQTPPEPSPNAPIIYGQTD